jgi:DNA-binding CsgD family transcriptional regulator
MSVRENETEAVKAGVLLFTQDQPAGEFYVAALERETVAVEWVKTQSELQLRLERSDLPKPALLMVLASRYMRVQPRDLARLAQRLATNPGAATDPDATRSTLGPSLDGYSALRSLSRRQKQVLELYLVGNNDEEIAEAFRCSGATVHAHWRRMARKANGAHKADVVTDLHRFLAGSEVNPS